jgi:hypothetical protein
LARSCAAASFSAVSVASARPASRRCAHGVDAVDLLALERRVDAEDLDLVLVLVAERVDADDDALAAVDLRLQLVGRVGDLALREEVLDRLHHPPEGVDAGEVLARAPSSISSVSASTKYAPPSGSIVLATPVS